jgi:putative transcriptional regulator
MTPEELKNAKRRPRVTVIRRALNMTQEQFAAEFNIPLGTLRDWEQERAEPDATARAYLRAIAGNPQAVSQALHSHPRPAAAE